MGEGHGIKGMQSSQEPQRGRFKASVMYGPQPEPAPSNGLRSDVPIARGVQVFQAMTESNVRRELMNDERAS
jgi:hypothetical protein